MQSDEPKWYLDCFHWGQVSGMGRKYPVNTFYHESPEVITDLALRVLMAKNGIDEIRISRETLGQSPRRYEPQKTEI